MQPLRIGTAAATVLIAALPSGCGVLDTDLDHACNATINAANEFTHHRFTRTPLFDSQLREGLTYAEKASSREDVDAKNLLKDLRTLEQNADRAREGDVGLAAVTTPLRGALKACKKHYKTVRDENRL